MAVGDGMERRDIQSETRKIWWWGVKKRAAEKVFLRGEGLEEGMDLERGGVKNPDGIIEKQKEILCFLLCRVSQFPILE